MKKIIAFILATVMLMATLTACGSKQAPSAEIPGDGALEIPVSELSEKIQIYSFTLDGLNMEVLAAKDADGTVACAYYAENLEDGSVVVYNSTALEEQADVVNGILKLAIETFHIAADGTNV